MSDQSLQVQSRRPAMDGELEALVEAEITAHLSARTPFTAYQITLDLRRANPHLEILNDDVKAIVHSSWEGGVSPFALTYGRQGKLFPKSDEYVEAWEYAPPALQGTYALASTVDDIRTDGTYSTSVDPLPTGPLQPLPGVEPA